MSFAIKPSPHIRDRRDFAALCNYRELFDAVEVGTDRGDFAWHFMRSWRGHCLRCVDPYDPYPEMPHDRTADLLIATNRLAEFGDRVKFIRAASPGVIKLIPKTAPINFVYVDGAHDYQSVAADTAAWWERIWPGGVLAGHDFDDDHADAKRAVSEFAEARGLTIYLTREGCTSPSWYVEKPAQ